MAPRRYDFIMQNHRQAWIDWRCRKMYDLFLRLRDRVRSANPRLRLSVTIYSVASSSNRPPTDRELKEAGIDISLLGKLSRRRTGRWRSFLWQPRGSGSLAATFSRSVDGRKEFSGVSRPAAWAFGYDGHAVYRGGRRNRCSAALGFPPQAKEPWASAASNPPGRMRLERFATVLGETDAAMLGDGGNSYVFGSDAMREFLTQYRLLPATRFHRLISGSDAVAVWQKDKMFYLVNMTPFSVLATLHIDSAAKVTPSRRNGEGNLVAHNGAAKFPWSPLNCLCSTPIATKLSYRPTRN